LSHLLRLISRDELNESYPIEELAAHNERIEAFVSARSRGAEVPALPAREYAQVPCLSLSLSLSLSILLVTFSYNSFSDIGRLRDDVRPQQFSQVSELALCSACILVL
jgi:hypothetical protein